MRAASKGVVETVRILLGSGADVNRRGEHGESALMLACQRGDEAAVRVWTDGYARHVIRRILNPHPLN